MHEYGLITFSDGSHLLGEFSTGYSEVCNAKGLCVVYGHTMVLMGNYVTEAGTLQLHIVNTCHIVKISPCKLIFVGDQFITKTTLTLL